MQDDVQRRVEAFLADLNEVVRKHELTLTAGEGRELVVVPLNHWHGGFIRAEPGSASLDRKE